MLKLSYEKKLCISLPQLKKILNYWRFPDADAKESHWQTEGY